MTYQRQKFIANLGPIGKEASKCIRCGFCNAVCPTSNVASAFKDSRTSRGRVILLQSLMEDIGAQDPYSENFKDLIDLCYSCRRCIPICPAGIHIPDLMSHARYSHLSHTGSSSLTLGHKIFANYGLFDRFGSTLSPAANWLLARGTTRRLMEWATHIDSRARLPKFASGSFESWFRKQPEKALDKKMVYFVDSYANYNNPSIGKTTYSILERLGYQMILPPQRESGMPAIEYGMLDKARDLARYNISHLAPYAKQGIRIVCSSPAATYLLRDGYKTILNEPDLDIVSTSTVDIAEIMLEELNNGYLQFQNNVPIDVKYHYCCLSKALSLGPKTTLLLTSAGVRFQMIEDCCGGAGVWGTFKENYEISSEIAAKLKPKIESSTILTESETCRLQIEAHCTSSVMFPLELLASRISPALKL